MHVKTAVLFAVVCAVLVLALPNDRTQPVQYTSRLHKVFMESNANVLHPKGGFKKPLIIKVLCLIYAR